MCLFIDKCAKTRADTNVISINDGQYVERHRDITGK